MSVVVQTERFEGPLGLLLYLIRKEEMDIFDIDIHHITRQYLSYIKSMKKLDLEMAGDFIALAATLIQIKSRMLLPQHGEGEEGEESDFEDPRQELAARLFEYQKYKEASQDLYGRPLLGRDLWIRGTKERFDDEAPEEETVLEDNPLFSLIATYRRIIKSTNKVVHTVKSALQSISERISEMRIKMPVGQMVSFFSLMSPRVFAPQGMMVGPMPPGVLAYDQMAAGERDPLTEHRSNHVLVTFLSLLELAKIGFVKIFQSEDRGEIQVEALKTITADALSRVEEYEVGPQVSADEVAEKLFGEFEAIEEEDIQAEKQLTLAAAESSTDAKMEVTDSGLHSGSDNEADGVTDSRNDSKDQGKIVASTIGDVTSTVSVNESIAGQAAPASDDHQEDLFASSEELTLSKEELCFLEEEAVPGRSNEGGAQASGELDKSPAEAIVASEALPDLSLEESIADNLAEDFLNTTSDLPQWEKPATDDEILKEEEILFSENESTESLHEDGDAPEDKMQVDVSAGVKATDDDSDNSGDR